MPCGQIVVPPLIPSAYDSSLVNASRTSVVSPQPDRRRDSLHAETRQLFNQAEIKQYSDARLRLGGRGGALISRAMTRLDIGFWS